MCYCTMYVIYKQETPLILIFFCQFSWCIVVADCRNEWKPGRRTSLAVNTVNFYEALTLSYILCWSKCWFQLKQTAAHKEGSGVMAMVLPSSAHFTPVWYYLLFREEKAHFSFPPLPSVTLPLLLRIVVGKRKKRWREKSPDTHRL